MFKKFFIVIAMFFALSVLASAQTVYVSENGGGTGESASTPTSSISEAYASLKNGGEIVIVGDYNIPAITFPEVNGDVKISGGKLNLLSR